MTAYPHTSQVNEIRTDYYDQECGHVWIATCTNVYEDHVQLEISYPHGYEIVTVCVAEVKLKTPQDYKSLLEKLGYYDYD